MKKLLITSTSFQDSPGTHHDVIKSQNFEIDFQRGPLNESQLIPIIHKYDYIICGDDEYSKAVLEKGKRGRLKVLSKYGIGLDKINLEIAKELGIMIFNTPNINSEAVSEHVFALLLAFEKNIIQEDKYIRENNWNRLIGNEIFNKTILVMGLGSVGKHVCSRANAFGMNIFGYDLHNDKKFNKKNNVHFVNDFKEIIEKVDYISLNIPLTSETKHIINRSVLNKCNDKVVIVNTARGELVNEKEIVEFLKANKIRAYLTDVLKTEPMIKNHPLLSCKNVIITPHIGSRNFQTVERQALKAIENLINYINK